MSASFQTERQCLQVTVTTCTSRLHWPGVVAVDPSLDRNMIHQCTYTTVHAQNYCLTGCGGGDVIMVANRKPC